MSLEIAIQENTKAIQTLIATLAAMPIIEAKDTAPAVTVADTKPTSKAGKSTKTEAPTPVETAPKEEPVVVEETPLAEEAPAITLDDLTKKFTTFVKAKGKDAAVALLTSYGVAKLRLLPADKYADFEAELGA